MGQIQPMKPKLRTCKCS